MLEKVDETINTICDWMQKEFKDVNGFGENTLPVMADMTRALAELVSARAQME